jgi:hypothetical protein
MGRFKNIFGIFLWAIAVVGIGVWWVLLSTICSAPITPHAVTGNTLAYNCHGTTVFITVWQRNALYVLIPVIAIVAFAANRVRRWRRS